MPKLTTCPNCNTTLRLTDNFCPQCGQENKELTISVRKLLPEVLENLIPIGLTSVDNKFWNSIKAIFSRPGQLTNDFLAGRRTRYLPPMRLYIWSSVVFFLLLGELVSQKSSRAFTKFMSGFTDGLTAESATVDKLISRDTLERRGLIGVASVVIAYSSTPERAAKTMKQFRQVTPTQIDSLLSRSKFPLTARNRSQLRQALSLLPNTPPATDVSISVSSVKKGKRAKLAFTSDSARLAFGRQMNSMTDAEVDSVLTKIGGKINWFNRTALRKFSRIVGFTSAAEGIQAVTSLFLKNLPGVMFVLMPFVAGLLWFFYARRKQYRRHYYEHLIFSIHIHTALFLFASSVLAVVWVLPQTPFADQLIGGLLLICWFYLLLALRHVYHQSWLRTIVKWLFISFAYAVTVVLFMAGLALVGVMTV